MFLYFWIGQTEKFNDLETFRMIFKIEDENEYWLTHAAGADEYTEQTNILLHIYNILNLMKIWNNSNHTDHHCLR